MVQLQNGGGRYHVRAVVHGGAADVNLDPARALDRTIKTEMRFRMQMECGLQLSLGKNRFGVGVCEPVRVLRCEIDE